MRKPSKKGVRIRFGAGGFPWTANQVTAATVTSDRLSTTFPGPDHSVDELRFLTAGMSNRKRVLVVAHTEEDDVLRIISARRATRRERASGKSNKSFEPSRFRRDTHHTLQVWLTNLSRSAD
jgi:uncharacterized DUF497 family protein